MELGISVEEAAKRLGVSERLLWSMVADGEIATYRLRNRRLVPLTELQRIVESAKEEARMG
ncbi:MAG: excisionase family DNA-binding protein [Nitrospirota bacterium]